MKSVLISIQPKWCIQIAAGEKTIEVRKKCPKLETPFKVYIYCTKSKPILGRCLNDNSLKETIETDFDIYNRDTLFRANGRVIGEFVCNKVSVFGYDEHIGYPTPQYEGDPSFCDCGEGYWITCGELEKVCLSHDELMEYGNKKTLYGWEISKLVIYDKPKQLNRFILANTQHFCLVERPPQSWCYVEETEDA